MKLLLDTHLLLWAAQGVEHLPVAARTVMSEPENELLFSVASLWEIVIKCGLGREDFKVDPRVLRRGLLDNGYLELPILSEHAVAVMTLPPIHNDPFDRLVNAASSLFRCRISSRPFCVAFSFWSSDFISNS